MNAYRLYLSPGACSLAAHIALEETGAPFDVEIVSVQKQQNLEARYLAINAKARVPVLAIPGEPHVTETPAILTYLARRYPEAQLLPFGDLLREARCHEWLAWLVGCAWRRLWRAVAAGPLHRRSGPAWRGQRTGGARSKPRTRRSKPRSPTAARGPSRARIRSSIRSCSCCIAGASRSGRHDAACGRTAHAQREAERPASRRALAREAA